MLSLEAGARLTGSSFGISAAVSGLAFNASRIGDVADNIANVLTSGHKAVDVDGTVPAAGEGGQARPVYRIPVATFTNPAPPGCSRPARK